MIIKSSQRANRKQLAEHLASDENERATVVNSGGVLAQDVAGALAEMEAMARGTRCIKYMYHVSISPEETARMSREDWVRTWALHDQVHGLKGLPFVEVEHAKRGRDGAERVHRHRVYCRVDETGRARNLDWTRIKNERISRQMEAELGHAVVAGKHNLAVLSALRRDGLAELAEQLAPLADAAPSIPEYTHDEWQLAKRGANIDQVREALAEAWRSSDTPEAFEAALAARGFVLARGDRVPVAVGLDGQEIPLLRAINVARKKAGEPALKKADLLPRLPAKLSDIDQVREAQAERQTQTQPQETDDMASDITSTGRLAPAGEAKQAKGKKEDRPDWVQRREQMLFDIYVYGSQINGTDLARYWKMERGEDGLIRFRNRNGEIVDRGEALDVNSSRGGTARAAAAAVTIAKAKGWAIVTAAGSDEFKTEIFRAASAAGLAVEIDNDHDRQLQARALGQQSEQGRDQLADARATAQDQAPDINAEQDQHRGRSGPRLG